ncbi:hypothetical protein DFH09DRAFT_1172145 [Mycena vulgaris]|nr:hypothetical protein DFH09DRAFT_1172145 [Mycena vulgaris]
MAAMAPGCSLILATICTSRLPIPPRRAAEVVVWAARDPNIRHVCAWTSELGEVSILTIIELNKLTSAGYCVPSGELVSKESAYRAPSTTPRSSHILNTHHNKDSSFWRGSTSKTTATRVCANSASILHVHRRTSMLAPSAATGFSSLIQNQQKPARE